MPKLTQGQRLEQIARARTLTDEDIADLASMKTLRSLELSPGARWPRGALAKLAGLPIRSLKLQRAELGLADVEALGRMRALRMIDLKATPLTPKLLRPLARISTLESLWIEKAGLDDDALAALVGAPKLKWLDLRGNAISDEGLEHLARIPTLQTLDLDGAVTDAGILKLAPLRKLTSLQVRSKKVTAAGRNAFFAAQQALLRGGAKTVIAAKPGDDAALRTAKDVVLAFGKAMTRWNLETMREDKALGPAPARERQSFKRRRVEAKVAIFEKLCTPRKRAYDDPRSLVFGTPKTPPEKTKILEATQPSASRIEVTVRVADALDSRYRYVVVKKPDGWRIDQVKVWRAGRWMNGSLSR